jgi:hypothetical protein
MAFLVFFLVLVVQTCMLVQHLAARGWAPGGPGHQRQLHWRSWAGGCWPADCWARLLAGFTPFKPLAALAMALVACVAGSLGHLVMKAIKRDRGVTHWGSQAARSPAPAACSTGSMPVLRRAGVLPFGPLDLGPLKRPPCASSASTPACNAPALAWSTPKGRAALRGQRHHPDQPEGRRPAARAPEGPVRRHRRGGAALPARGGGLRDRVRQRQPAGHAAAGPGARLPASPPWWPTACRWPSTPPAAEEGRGRLWPGRPSRRCRRWSSACCSCPACPARTPPTRWGCASPTPRWRAPWRPSTRWPAAGAHPCGLQGRAELLSLRRPPGGGLWPGRAGARGPARRRSPAPPKKPRSTSG